MAAWACKSGGRRGRCGRAARTLRGGMEVAVALWLAGFAGLRGCWLGSSRPGRDPDGSWSEAGPEVFQGLAGLGLEGLLGDLGFADAVEAEAAEVLAQLAPGEEGPGCSPVEEAEGADGALGDVAVGTGVADAGLLAVGGGATQEAYQADGVGMEVRGEEGLARAVQLGRQDGLDLAQGV